MTSPPISTEDNSAQDNTTQDNTTQEAVASVSEASPDLSGVWRCFFSTFVTIFLAELGDKTQVATLLMSAQSHQPWVVFGGAAAALVSTSLVGVLLGQWLAKYLTPQKLELATGSILAVVSVLLFIDIAGMP
jgi:Ca2+/H+ antiporter, TMEM165/GDT1 family